MDILKKLSLLLFAPMLQGCYTDFEPDGDDIPVLCMNAVIDADREFTIQLTHSWRYDDYEAYKADHTVSDATVEAFADGRPVGEACFSRWEEVDEEGVHWQRQGYRIDYSPQEGEQIRLHAVSPRYGTADATVSVPFKPLTDKPQVDSTITANNYIFEDCIYQNFAISLGVSLPVIDRPGVDEYYQLAWESVSPDDCDFNSGNPEYDMEPIFSEHVDALETVFASDTWGFTVFSDRSFRNASYPLRLMFKNMSLHHIIGDIIMTSADASTDTLPPGCKLRLTLFSLDRSLYNWYMYDWHDSESFISTLGSIGLAESLIGYSNVSTHAGLVVARNRSVIEIDIK